MNHEELKILVSAYHDGEVTAEERTQVEAHLAECAECTEALAAYGRVGRTVHNLPRGAPSRELWLRVQQGLAPRRRSFWQRLVPVVPALALLVLGITLFIVLGGPLGGRGARLLARKESGIVSEVQQPQLATAPSGAMPAPTAAPLAPGAVQSCTVAVTVTSPCLDGAIMGTAGVASCPGTPLALEMVSVSVRSDTARASPRLQGVLYDAAGQGLPDVTLVVSGTAGWLGTVTTAVDGTFALDLPESGTYRVALALAPVAAKEQAVEEYAGARNYYMLPDGSRCRGLPDGALAPLVLDIHDEAIVTLRVK